MTYPFYQAVNYTKGRGGHIPRLIVVHTMETPESEGRAKQVAGWFAGKTAPQASAHYMVDDKQVVQSVSEFDTAWAVDDFALNQQSVSIEHAGSASQSAAQWADPYSQAELKLSAALAAEIATRYRIPVVKLTPADILAGKAGICGHHDITIAKAIAGGHTDPGINFPWDAYLGLVKTHTQTSS
jgi:N-acetyl-anhydromuramyl-L-alanine amidase AmpD